MLRGDAGKNFLSGQGGRDMMFGLDGDDDMLGGGGADMLYGDGGSDRIFGDDGDDLIDAGAGDDHAQGGAGNDLFLASQGDGDDTYWGDDMTGGAIGGNDTLDMAAITANITVDLGTGFKGRGSAWSSQSGTDVLWGIENVVTGSGDDTITASKSVNVMDGGAGHDTFRFLSSADADGDTILGFQPGDKIDLSAIDADSGSSNQAFTLVTGSGFNAAGALRSPTKPATARTTRLSRAIPMATTMPSSRSASRATITSRRRLQPLTICEGGRKPAALDVPISELKNRPGVR